VDGVVIAFADSGGHLPAVDFARSVSVGRIRCHGRTSARQSRDCGGHEKTGGWFDSTFCSFSEELIVGKSQLSLGHLPCVYVSATVY